MKAPGSRFNCCTSGKYAEMELDQKAVVKFQSFVKSVDGKCTIVTTSSDNIRFLDECENYEKSWMIGYL